MAQSMRHLAGLLLAHDILMWGQPQPDPWIQRTLRRWGWDDKVEFLPYWSNQRYVKVDAGGAAPVMVSLYRRPHGLIAVVMNDTDAAVGVKLSVDLKALGLARAGFFSVADMGHPPLKTPRYSIGDGRIARIGVPARSYVLLQFIN